MGRRLQRTEADVSGIRERGKFNHNAFYKHKKFSDTQRKRGRDRKREIQTETEKEGYCFN